MALLKLIIMILPIKTKHFILKEIEIDQIYKIQISEMKIFLSVNCLFLINWPISHIK